MSQNSADFTEYHQYSTGSNLTAKSAKNQIRRQNSPPPPVSSTLVQTQLLTDEVEQHECLEGNNSIDSDQRFIHMIKRPLQFEEWKELHKQD
jgi:hypothetical protein